MGKLAVGRWEGPGILALVGGAWRWYTPTDAPYNLREIATAIVGTDGAVIGIARVVAPPEGES